MIRRCRLWLFPMGSQSSSPARSDSFVPPTRRKDRRDLVSTAADQALDEQLRAITVGLRRPMLYSELLLITKIRAAWEGFALPEDESVLRRRAVEYARDNMFAVHNLQPLINRAGVSAACKAAWPQIYAVIREVWPGLATECPVTSWNDLRAPFHRMLIHERRRLSALLPQDQPSDPKDGTLPSES